MDVTGDDFYWSPDGMKIVIAHDLVKSVVLGQVSVWDIRYSEGEGLQLEQEQVLQLQQESLFEKRTRLEKFFRALVLYSRKRATFVMWSRAEKKHAKLCLHT